VAEEAAFCINCGALLHQATAQPRTFSSAASGTTVHLQAGPLFSEAVRPIAAHAGSAGAEAAVALSALGFAIAEIIGIAELIAQNHWTGFELWPAALLAGGALLAEHDWMNGALRRGLYGMACWGTLPWLLAIQQDLAWLLLPALGWWLIWLFDRQPL
jgi:hypothetical protein